MIRSASYTWSTTHGASSVSNGLRELPDFRTIGYIPCRDDLGYIKSASTVSAHEEYALLHLANNLWFSSGTLGDVELYLPNQVLEGLSLDGWVGRKRRRRRRLWLAACRRWFCVRRVGPAAARNSIEVE